MKKTYTALLAIILLAVCGSAQAQSPTIISFSPTSGPVGTTVTINGTGFNTTEANNIVLFGATPVPVSTAMATKLTVVAPVGTSGQGITVINKTTRLTAAINRSFKITFEASFNLGPAKTYSVSSEAWTRKTDDIDRDGLVDVVMSNYMEGTIDIYRNITIPGSNTVAYDQRRQFPIKARLGKFETADLNGDGLPEIITTHFKAITITRNSTTPGNIIYTDKIEIPLTEEPGSTLSDIAVEDIDGDGRPDIVLTHWGRVKIFRNTSTGGVVSFAAPLLGPVMSVGYIKVFDIDGDGKKDIVALSYNDNRMFMARNQSVPGSINASSFGNPVVFAGVYTDKFEIADIDGDNKPDIVLGNAIFRNTSTAGVVNLSSFAAPLVFSGIHPSYGFKIADVTGDGKSDLINAGANEIKILRNLSNPGSLSYENFPSLSFAATVGIIGFGDVNGDGKQDLVGPGYVFLNGAPTYVKPVVNSFSPLKGDPGTSVTITGRNFGATPAANIVHFGAVKAEVTAATATQLTVTVPVGATYQPLSVLNTTLNRSGVSKVPFVATNNTRKPKILAADFDPIVALNAPSGSLGWFAGSAIIQDMNGDGKPDIILSAKNGLVIYQNNAIPGSAVTASMFAKVELAMPNLLTFDIGDLDNDGKPDIVFTAGDELKDIYTGVARNISTGGNISAASFAAPITRATPGAPSGPMGLIIDPIVYISIVDFDSDGTRDIIMTGNSGGSFRGTSTPGNMTSVTLFGEGRGRFAETKPLFGDFNLDGKPDFVTLTPDPWGDVPTGFSVRDNKSFPGSFVSLFNESLTTRPQQNGLKSLAVADIDNDGRPDVLGGIYGGLNMWLVKQNAPQFYLYGPTQIPFVYDHVSVTAGDINGDGKLDIVNMSNVSSILTNNYAGGEFEASSFSIETGFDFRGRNLIADMDGDGIPDIVSYNGTNVSITRYNPSTSFAATKPAVINVSTAVTPNGDGVNDVFTIQGIDKYPDNNVTITNKQGSGVFRASGYDNGAKAFSGVSNTGVRQQAGTYFYTIDYNDNGVRRNKSGYLVLKY